MDLATERKSKMTTFRRRSMSTPRSMDLTAEAYNLPLNDEAAAEETHISRSGWAGSLRRVKNALRMSASSSKPRRRSKGSCSSSLADSISSSDFELDNSNSCSRSIGSNISGFSDITGMSDEYESNYEKNYYESMSMSTGNISFDYEQQGTLSICSIDPEEEYRQAIRMAAKLRAEAGVRAKRQQQKIEKIYRKMQTELIKLKDQQSPLIKASGQRKLECEKAAVRVEAVELECLTRRQQNRILNQRKHDLEIQKMKIQHLTDQIHASIINDEPTLQKLQTLQKQKERIQRGRDEYLRTLEGIQHESQRLRIRQLELPMTTTTTVEETMAIVQKEDTKGRIAKLREEVQQMRNLVYKIRMRQMKQRQQQAAALSSLDKEHHMPTSSIIGTDIVIVEGCDESEAISFADESSKDLS